MLRCALGIIVNISYSNRDLVNYYPAIIGRAKPAKAEIA